MKADSTLVWWLEKARNGLSLILHRLRLSPEISAARKIDIKDIRDRQDRIIEAVNLCINEIRKLHRVPVHSASFKHGVDSIEGKFATAVFSQTRLIADYVKDLEQQDREEQLQKIHDDAKLAGSDPSGQLRAFQEDNLSLQKIYGTEEEVR